MKREQIFTTQLIASFAGEGALVHKLDDMPRFPGQKTRFARPKPCDIMGVLPGGRHLSIEVKQSEASQATGKPIAFGSALEEHQRAHLAHVHELGGCAVVALVSWRLREFARLYLWTWAEFLSATGGKRQIYQHEMLAQRYLDRRVPAERGWDVADHITEWSARSRRARMVRRRHVLEAVTVLRAGASSVHE